MGKHKRKILANPSTKKLCTKPRQDLLTVQNSNSVLNRLQLGTFHARRSHRRGFSSFSQEFLDMARRNFLRCLRELIRASMYSQNVLTIWRLNCASVVSFLPASHQIFDHKSDSFPVFPLTKPRIPFKHNFVVISHTPPQQRLKFFEALGSQG